MLLGWCQSLEGRVFEPVSAALWDEALIRADGRCLQQGNDRSLQGLVERSRTPKLTIGVIEARLQRRADPSRGRHVHRLHRLYDWYEARVVPRIRKEPAASFSGAESPRGSQRPEVYRRALPARDRVDDNHEAPDEVIGGEPGRHARVCRQRGGECAGELVAFVEWRQGNHVARWAQNAGTVGRQQRGSGGGRLRRWRRAVGLADVLTESTRLLLLQRGRLLRPRARASPRAARARVERATVSFRAGLQRGRASAPLEKSILP